MAGLYLEKAKPMTWPRWLQDMPKKSDSAPGKKTGGCTSILSEKVKITADKATNSLVIMAEKSEYAALERDHPDARYPRAMVYIGVPDHGSECEQDFNIGPNGYPMGTPVSTEEPLLSAGGFRGAGSYPNVKGDCPDNRGVGTLPDGFSLGF